MKTKATTVLLGVGIVAATVLLPQAIQAQPGGGSDSGGGEATSDAGDLVYCAEDGSSAHYEEYLE